MTSARPLPVEVSKDINRILSKRIFM